jgi:hypothetical protein
MGVGTAVGPNVDAYGKYARAGALADYLEVRALHGQGMTAADLQDVAVQEGWSRKERRTILVQDDAPELDAEQWSEMAFTEVDARIDILEEDYPFGITAGKLVYAGPPDPLDDPYIGLLALTVVHGWNLASPAKPTAVLEDVVRRVLEARSLLAADMGTGDRQGLTFEQNLLAQGQACGLMPTDKPRPRATHAKDAGVDTLGTIIWPDRRQGQWVFIGQATCGSSLTWKRKLKEPEGETWRSYLQEALRPQPFLAVPHHIDDRAWTYLMEPKIGVLLDRLRMAPKKGPNTPDERALIDVILKAQVL